MHLRTAPMISEATHKNNGKINGENQKKPVGQEQRHYISFRSGVLTNVAIRSTEWLL
jgi:hypothetical protein